MLPVIGCVPCPVLCMLCSALYTLCPALYMLCPALCMLCPALCMLYPALCMLCPVLYLLWPALCMLCPVSCTCLSMVAEPFISLMLHRSCICVDAAPLQWAVMQSIPFPLPLPLSPLPPLKPCHSNASGLTSPLCAVIYSRLLPRCGPMQADA